MTKMSFMDKINILIETSKSSNFFVVILLIIAFLAFILFTTNNKNKKTGQKIFISIYTFITLFLIIAFHESLGKMYTYMMNNLFIVIYFPNLAIYLAAIIATNIILWISVFKSKTAKIIKNVNIIVFCILNYILALLLQVITDKKLDIFTQESIYGNNQAHALIELSSIIFIVWIIFLILYKIILSYLKKDEKPKVRRVIVEKKVKKLPENFIATTAPLTVRLKEKKDLVTEYIEEKNIVKAKEEVEILEEPIEELIALFNDTEKEETKENSTILPTENSIESLLTPILEGKSNIPETTIKVDEKEEKETIKPLTALEEIIYSIEKTSLENKENYEQITLPLDEKIEEQVEENEEKIEDSKNIETEKEQEPEKNIIFNETLDGLLTLNDYKALSKMLKEYKIKQEAAKEQENEQIKMEELNNLYRSVIR